MNFTDIDEFVLMASNLPDPLFVQLVNDMRVMSFDVRRTICKVAKYKILNPMIRELFSFVELVCDLKELLLIENI